MTTLVERNADMQDTARWPKDYQREQWKGESIAIIGSGASSIQTLPNMQPYVKHIDVYVRTAVWFISIAGNNGAGEVYTEEQRNQFRTDTKELVKHAKYLETEINAIWDLFFTNSETQKAAQQTFGARMAEFIKDKRLLEGFSPKFAIGCRRITPGGQATPWKRYIVLTEFRGPLYASDPRTQRRRTFLGGGEDHRRLRH